MTTGRDAAADDDTNRNDRRGHKRPREERDGGDDFSGEEKATPDGSEAAAPPPPPRPSIEANATTTPSSEMAPHHRAPHASPLVLPDPRTLRKLRLEAIFHPKFENENRSDASVRSAMLDRVSNGRGCLEVTLKHSGSLLLWSGNDGRYYSKNSTDNAFTAVGECLLRQHFARAWWREAGDDGDGGGGGVADAAAEEAYRRCGRYVSSRRLTLAFEVVTSKLLGDHGERPERDYLVLTAVADRTSGKFHSTAQASELARKFRLPTNDSWTFRTKDGADRLFELYDAKRETGMAEDVVGALDDAAEGRVVGMYPHATFQGNVLEGIVIRYVPYGNDGGRSAEERRRQAAVDDLGGAEETRRISELVPPETPPSFELLAGETSAPPVLATDLRRLYERSRDATTSCGGERKDFETLLREVLDRSDAGGGRRRVRNPRAEAKTKRDGKKTSATLDVPAMADELLARDDKCDRLDEETVRIARLIRKLRGLNRPCDFKVLREVAPPSRGRKERTRWLCVVHVYNDDTFQKYFRAMEPGDMALYRGFCVELGFDGENEEGDDGDRDEGRTNAAVPASKSFVPAGSATAFDNDENDDDDIDELMLKMKFLPYMVRTFGCRNGLGVLDKNGPEAFDRYAMSLLSKWGTSRAAVARWQPFFHAWGLYAHDILRRQSRAPDGNCGKAAPAAADNDDDLPPLSGRHYLDHLERFTELFYGNKLSADGNGRPEDERPSAPAFRGIVVVVALNKTTSSAAASRVARSLGARRTVVGTKNLGEEDASRSLLPDGAGGLVCAATIDGGVSKVRRLFKKFGDSMSVVLVGCADEDVIGSFPAGSERSAAMGKAKAFRKSRCARVVDVAAEDVLLVATAMEDGSGGNDGGGGAFEDVLNKLREASDSLPKPDSRPGMLLFFPGLPGSGKSTLCGPSTKKALEDLAAESSAAPEAGKTDAGTTRERPRNVVVRVGDDVKEKYWPLVSRERMEDPSSIYVADKNAPPPSWRTVGDICSASRALAVAVLPDAAALSTTTLSGGTNGPDGVGRSSSSRAREHRYPFSLRYLAACVQRVLDRPKNTHKGKLDASTEHACMIVVKFFCLYRGLTAERFEAQLRKKLDEAGAAQAGSVVRVPFFATPTLEDLPRDLDETLRDAIRLQFALGNQAGSSARKEENAELTNAMERRIRASVAANRDALRAMAVDEETSRASLLSQLAGRISTLGASFGVGGPSAAAAPTTASKFIEIASIDVDAGAVRSLLTASAKRRPSIAAFLDRIGGLADPAPRPTAAGAADDDGDGGASEPKAAARCVAETHVTMAHHLQLSQLEMEASFGELQGERIDVAVTGFLFDDDVAALSVDVPGRTSGEPALDVPAPRNEFPHVTVWCGGGVEARRSNDLPALVSRGDARRVDFDEAATLEGTFKFWTT